MDEFLIYSGNLYKFREKMKNVISKAKKYNCDVTFIEGDTVLKNISGKPKKFVSVKVHGIVKISNDYEAIGTVKSSKDATYIRLFDGTKRANLSESELICKHCGKKLKRGVLLRNIKTKEEMLVGSECAKSYIGIDLRHLAFIAQFETLKKEFYEPRERKDPFYYDTEKLTLAGIFVGMIRGIEPNEFSYKACTLYKKLKDQDAHVNNKILEIYNLIDDDMKDKASHIIEELKSDSTYKVLYDTEKTPYDYAEYILSKLRDFFPVIQDTSKYYGNVGDRFEIKGRLKFITTFNSEWGGGNIYEITDLTDPDYHFKWFTAKDVPDGEYILKGIIKAHSEYRDKKETIVKNVKIL